MPNYQPNLGSCCACGTRRRVRNVLTLQKKHPQPGKGWGCYVCKLPSDGAVAVVCDKCLAAAPQNLKWACAGYPAEQGRVPIEELKGKHEHHADLHQAGDN